LNIQFSNAQCDFPWTTHTDHFEDAIVYTGEINRIDFGNGTSVFNIDPSKLSFKDNNGIDDFPKSSNGVWLIKWNYAAQPNRWQTLPADCSSTGVTLKSVSGAPINKGWLEVDFFYYDESMDVSATFEGTIQYEIKKATSNPNKLHPTTLTSIF